VNGWPLVVIALATSVLAVAAVVYVLAYVAALRRMEAMSNKVERLLDVLDRDARPAIDSARRTVEDTGRIVARLRHEIEAYAGTSKGVRDRVERVTAAAEERFTELETLFDLLQDEMEDTILDVAAALRTTRHGVSVFKTMKRAFLGRR
jgi:uncharacterized protein YoxC